MGPNALASPRLLALGCRDDSAELEPSDRDAAAAAAAAASFDPVELSGLSISMLLGDWSSATALLLWRRCRFDEEEEETVAAVRGGRAPAPGPGAFLGGAAAIGTTPLPPTTPPLDGAALPW